MDRARFQPELCCLKEFGPLGEVLAAEIPAHTGLLAHKYDFAVLNRLTLLMRERKIDAVVTVGTGGDKMFWGRLAAWRAGVPVVLSALHSTGLPDHVEIPNRLLVPITDGFIGCAAPHARYLTTNEGCPARKVYVVPNGVDTDRFCPVPASDELRASLGLAPENPVAAIVAALRPEKNHELFLRASKIVHDQLPQARFLIVGDGARRAELEALNTSLGLENVVKFLGTRNDVPQVLSLVDTLVLSSHMEANPVSILEALSCGKPVVATRVGSIPETVHDGVNGYLVSAGDDQGMADRIAQLLRFRAFAANLGQKGRQGVIDHWSLDRMVNGYQDLITSIYLSKCRRPLLAELLDPIATTEPVEAEESPEPATAGVS
jgi:glycosyltransferase involved in cell wall biosynthesis